MVYCTKICKKEEEKQSLPLDMQMVNSFKHAKYKYLTRQILLEFPGLQLLST